MTTETSNVNSISRTGRLAGLLLLLSALSTGFSLGYVRSHLIISGDAAATAGNITANEFLFRAGIIGILITQIFMFFLGLTLYSLFKQVNKVLATVLFASVMMSVAIAVVDSLNNMGALFVLSRADYMKAFNPDQLNAMAMIFVRLANGGQGLLELFWAPYLFAFGLLAIKSRYLPKILGILLITSCIGFPINTLSKILIPDFHPVFFTQFAMFCGALGGIPVILWLLIKGAQAQPLDKLAS